jgi:hypothetical protein
VRSSPVSVWSREAGARPCRSPCARGWWWWWWVWARSLVVVWERARESRGRQWPWPSHDMMQVVLLTKDGLLLPPRLSSLHTSTPLPHHYMAHYCGCPLSASQPLNHPRTLRTGSGPAGEAYREHCSPSGANLQQKSLKRPAVKVGEGVMHQCMCIVALVRLPVGTGDGQRQPVPASAYLSAPQA